MAIGRIPEPGTGIPESIVDAKGDLITATAADTPARLAVGTNEHRLVADSGEATGLKYVADTTNYAIAAKGDLLVGTAADTLDKLSVGTNGHTLVADSSTSTGLKWAAASSPSFVGCRIYGNATQSLSNNTVVAITFNLEDFDTHSFHSTSSNTSRITIPVGKAGKYLFTGHGEIEANATGTRYSIIRKGGNTNMEVTTSPGGAGRANVLVSGIFDCAEGDYFELCLQQDSGGAKDNYPGSPSTSFACQYLGA